MNKDVQEIISELKNLGKEIRLFYESFDSHPWLLENNIPLNSQLSNLVDTNQSFIDFAHQENLDTWIERSTIKFKEIGVQLTYTELGIKPSCWCDLQLILPETLNELSSNSIRHGEATSLEILCLHSGNSTTLTFSDNGKGFDINSHTKGLGLKNLLENEKLPGAKILYKKLDPVGTVCCITIDHQIFESTFQPQEQQPSDWAKNLHDSICPEILGIILISQQLLEQVPESESDLWYQIKMLSEYCQKSFDKFRNISHSLEN